MTQQDIFKLFEEEERRLLAEANTPERIAEDAAAEERRQLEAEAHRARLIAEGLDPDAEVEEEDEEEDDDDLW